MCLGDHNSLICIAFLVLTASNTAWLTAKAYWHQTCFIFIYSFPLKHFLPLQVLVRRLVRNSCIFSCKVSLIFVWDFNDSWYMWRQPQFVKPVLKFFHMCLWTTYQTLCSVGLYTIIMAIHILFALSCAVHSNLENSNIYILLPPLPKWKHYWQWSLHSLFHCYWSCFLTE